MMAYVRDFSGIWGIKKYGMVFILSTPHFSLFFHQFSAVFLLFFLDSLRFCRTSGGISLIFCG